MIQNPRGGLQEAGIHAAHGDYEKGRKMEAMPQSTRVDVTM